MIKYFLAILLLFACLDSQGQQFSMDEWHDGRLVTTENDTITGNLKYNFKTNVVQLKSDKTNDIYAFSAQKILYFDFVDRLTRGFRKFYSLPYSINRNNYDIPVLFEVVVQGPLTFLIRESIENRTHTSAYYRSYTRLELVYNFYFLNEKGSITKFDGRKKNLAPFIMPFSTEVYKYMKEDRLKADQRADLARIVVYYNKLKEKSK